MAVMSKDEFYAATQSPDLKIKDRSEWAGTAASIVAAIAMNPDNFTKDGIVEAVQGLALQMDVDLLIEATTRMMMIKGQR